MILVLALTLAWGATIFMAFWLGIQSALIDRKHGADVSQAERPTEASRRAERPCAVERGD